MIRRAAISLMLAASIGLVFAPFLAPYAEDEQNRLRAEEKPARIEWRGGLYVIQADQKSEEVHLLVQRRGWHLFGVTEPGRIFLLGTDEYGRDVFSRFLFGARSSLAGGAMATLLALLLALVVGGAAGMGGGWLDESLMRVSELFLSLPWLYLLLALRAALPINLATGGAFWLVAMIIALSGWARTAKLIRGAVLSAQERPYVQAARAMGAGRIYLLTHHIAPQLRGLLRAHILVLAPQFVTADMALSFLGLGAGEPAASWGGMLAGMRRFSVLASHGGRVAPAILMMLFFISWQILGRDETDQARTIQ